MTKIIKTNFVIFIFILILLSFIAYIVYFSINFEISKFKDVVILKYEDKLTVKNINIEEIEKNNYIFYTNDSDLYKSNFDITINTINNDEIYIESKDLNNLFDQENRLYINGYIILEQKTILTIIKDFLKNKLYLQL
ncbi:MAG1140 family protein [Mycoplasma leonicaptivi]|uniref:MAG1140 family protein n=1 Tax=Mycoplasma leonicaptivi TaxID=36742 RepID=UPI00048A2BED|nr:hypothetical protein [Mycoplasma leonicaptivi]